MSNLKAPYAWKASIQASEKGGKLGGLLKENFEEASFLYDMYKTCTVTEVSQFKWSLEDT